MTARHRMGVVLTAVVLGAAGCTQVTAGWPAPEYAEPGAPIVWGECAAPRADLEAELPEGAECGMLGVPVDYAEPDGASAELAVMRIPATGSKLGSLVVNPGGPGGSGVDTVTWLHEWLPSEVVERYDVVGFDPRGVAASRPAVRCDTDEQIDEARAASTVDYSQAGVQQLDEDTEQYVQRCFDSVGDTFLSNIGTVSVAKDLDALRAALGDEKLTFLGYSYGTQIGYTYAELFPDNVGRMILDGAVDPNQGFMEWDIDQDRAFQQAFDAYAADCALSPDCPLGTDPTKSVDVFRNLLAPLVSEPAPTDDPRGLSYSDAMTATYSSLYSPAYWSDITVGLTELTEGYGDTLLMAADWYWERDGDGHYTNANDAYNAVTCADYPPLDDAVVVEWDRTSREVSPFLHYGEFTGYAPQPVCSFWPVPATSEPHDIEVTGLPPSLVVSTTGDPATPYEAGVELARQLGGALLTYEGVQHTIVFDGNTCVDDYATDYLINGTLPPDGATC